jgi:hypothetical protein
MVVAILAGVCALAGPLLTRKRSFVLVRIVQIGLLLVALGAGLAACGGAATSDPDPGTPPGTYTITVTATVTASSTTVIRTVQLPLTIN